MNNIAVILTQFFDFNDKKNIANKIKILPINLKYCQ
jgi:hypothetical protein